MGRQCSTITNDCPAGYDCVSKVGGPDGICSVPCTDFSDCPSFWDCSNVGNAQYCFPH